MEKTDGYSGDIQRMALENNDFRHVVYTSKFLQLVLMNLQPTEDIGLETHKTADQFFEFMAGEGMLIINKKEYYVRAGSIGIVPLGAVHNIVNISKTEDLKFYTIYSPPEHVEGLIQNLKDLD